VILTSIVSSRNRAFCSQAAALIVVSGANPRLAGSPSLTAPLVASLSILYVVPIKDYIVISYVYCTDRESAVHLAFACGIVSRSKD